MLSIKPLNRHGLTVVTSACLLLCSAQSSAGETPAVGGVEALLARAQPLQLQAQPWRAERSQTTSPTHSPPQSPTQTCPLGTANTCFTPVPAPAEGTYLNVGSFFDQRQVSTSSHYFVKLFEPQATGRLEVRGLGFHSTGSTPEANVIQAAGVLKTSAANPVFPRPEQLLELQAVNIAGETPPTETCVEFGTQEVVLEEDEAAWLVLRFPDTADSVFVGVLVDEDATDEPCDFLTQDGGELWFRPDPYHIPPVYDWAITAYTEPLPVKPVREEAWTLVKRLYRSFEPPAKATRLPR